VFLQNNMLLVFQPRLLLLHCTDLFCLRLSWLIRRLNHPSFILLLWNFSSLRACLPLSSVP